MGKLKITFASVAEELEFFMWKFRSYSREEIDNQLSDFNRFAIANKGIYGYICLCMFVCVFTYM